MNVIINTVCIAEISYICKIYIKLISKRSLKIGIALRQRYNSLKNWTIYIFMACDFIEGTLKVRLKSNCRCATWSNGSLSIYIYIKKIV